MKKLSFLLTSTFSFLLLTSSSLALGDIDTNPTNTTNDCLKLTQNLRLRSNDTTTSNEVTKLQLFLKNNGFLNINPTGYFGSVTKAAVIAYQLSVQLDGTGYVGSYTRGEIAKDTCDNVSDTPNTTTNNSVSSTIPPTFTSNTLGDGTKITRITATIKNGGEGLKYCITTLGSTPCTDLQPVASGGGINWTYTTTDGGTYTIDQDVSSFGYPFVNYQVTLKKKTGETVTSPMVVKNTTNNTNAATTNSTATYKFAKSVDRYWDENRFSFPYPPDIDKARTAFISTKRTLNNNLDSTQQQYRNLLNQNYPILSIDASGSYSKLVGGIYCKQPWESYNIPGDCSAPFDKTSTGPKKLRILIPPGVKTKALISGAAVIDSVRFVGVHSHPNAVYSGDTSGTDNSGLKFPTAVATEGLFPVYPFLDGFTRQIQNLNMELQMVNSSDFISKKANFVYLTFISNGGDMSIASFDIYFQIVDPTALKNWLDACKEEDINKCVEE